MPHPRVPEGEGPYEHRWLALIVVSMGVFLMALDITVVGVAAPRLSEELKASATQIQWAFDSFTVVLAGFVVLGGGLAERYGRKGFVQLGMLVFAAGSAISAYAPTIEVLIGGRAITGLGAAVVFPGCLSIVSALFEPKERHRAIGIFAAISAAGLASGPLVAGFLIEKFGWGAAFLVVVPVALLAILAMAVTVPPSRRDDAGALDGVGALLSVVSLGGIVFAVIEGPVQGWGSAKVTVPLFSGILATWAFIRWELKTASPLFDLRVFRDARVVGGALAMMVVYFTFNSLQLLLPQYLGYVLNLSSFQTGVVMLPFGIGLVALSPVSSQLVERHGQRAMLTFSLCFMGAGMVILAFMPVWGGIPNVMVGISVYTLGFGLIVAPATSAVMVAIPREKAGDGAAVNMVSRQIGGAIGVAVCGTVASMAYRSGLSLESFELTEDQVTSVEQSLSGVIALQGQLGEVAEARLDAMADAAMVRGVGFGMALAAGVTLAVGGVAYVGLRKPSDPA